VHDRLELVPAHQDSGDEKRRNDDPAGVEPRQRCDDDARVAVADRQALLKPVVDSGRLRHPGQTRQAAAEEHDPENRPADGHPGVLRRLRAFADHAHLVSPARSRQRRVENNRRRQTQDDPQVDPRADEARKSRAVREHGSSREAHPHGVAPRAEVQMFQPQDGHVIEHEGRQDLVHFQFGPEHACHQRPQTSRWEGRRKHEREDGRSGQTRSQEERHRGGADPTQNQLPLASHVPQPDLGRHRDCEAAQHQRDRFDHNLRKVVQASENPSRHRGVRGEGIGAGQQEHHPSHGERRHDRDPVSTPAAPRGGSQSSLESELHHS